ncbi:MAG TPA: tetratricopeptide repeat protein [Acidobacteriaceae bacterium]
MSERHSLLVGFLCLSTFAAAAQMMPSNAAPAAKIGADSTSVEAARNVPDPQHNAVATAWIDAAEKKLLANDVAGAVELLTQAKHLNDHERGLWLVTGDADWLRGQMELAIEDYKKETARYPNNVLAYSRLARAYLSQGEWANAERADRDWAKTEPGNVVPRVALAYALMMTERYGESATAYAEAIALSKTPDMLKVKLGRAQLRSGQKEAGEATLRSLLSQSSDPEVLNGAAYELSEAGLDLPESEIAAHKAVGIVSDRSAATRLETASDNDLAQMPLLAESWDTLGWIIFKLHRLPEAENYVRCAWLLGNHDEVGMHLGEIYEAEGKKGEAIATYRMAAGLIASQHPWPYYAQMKETMLSRVAALQQASGQPTAGPARADTSAAEELRTYTIPNPVNGSAATADFLLHMTEGEVDGVRFLRGDPSLKVAEGTLKGTKYNAAVPNISRARLLRRATVSCMPGAATCTLHLKGIFSARMEK